MILRLLPLFFTISFFVESQELSISNDYVHGLYCLDFQKLGNLEDDLKSSGNGEFYTALKSILYNQGFSKAQDSILVNNLPYGKNGILKDLVRSKYYLYNHRRHDSTFFLIDRAYKKIKAQRKIRKDLLKISLLSFLEYYARETTLNQSAFEDYLALFTKESIAVEDFSWLLFYKNLFEGRSVNSTLEKFLKSGKECDLFYKKNKGKLSIGQRSSLLENLIVHYRILNNDDRVGQLIQELEELGDKPYTRINRFNAFLDVGAQFALNKDYNTALNYFDKSYDIINESDSILGIISFNRFKSHYYHWPKGEFKEAYTLLNNAYNLSRNLNYEENSAKISERKVILETVEKEKQILVEQQRATKNRNWLIAASLALVLGSGIAILLQKNTTKKHQLAEQEAILKQQRVENLLKEHELISIDAMIAGQEKERQKVANELHDDLGSLMATIKLHFDNVKVDKKDPALKSAQDLLEKAYQKIRGMAHAKNSGVIANQGLLPAVQKMARTINETNALEIEVEDFGLADRMENSLELTIFRIIQELVTNVIKHASATKANIQFTQHQDNLNIIVEDDGKGFDMSAIKRSKTGMGLGTIEKRIEHLEGTFTVDSVLGKGTSILIDIPL